MMLFVIQFAIVLTCIGIGGRFGGIGLGAAGGLVILPSNSGHAAK